MPLQIPEKFQPQVQHALDKAVNDARLFPDPVHQAYEPEGINAPWFRNIYGRDFPLPGKLGDWIPPMAAAEGMTKAGESLGMGDYGKAGMEGGFAMLDAIDPSPIAWGAMGSGLGTMIGVNAKNFPLDQLDIARDIEKAGGGRDEIFQQTKLWRGADKKWRKEIDDSGMRMDADGLSWGETGDLNAGNSTVTGLQDVASHPKFDEAYSGVYGGRNDSGKRTTLGLNLERTGGDYNEATDSIGLGISKGDLGGDLAFNQNERSVLGHEVQHLVQGRENFARGGNTRSFYASAQQAESRINDANLRMKWIVQDMDKIQLGDITDASKHKLENLKKKYDKEMDYKLSLVPQAQADPYQQYRSLSGEVESRNVQTRLDWPQWKRDMIPPWMTEDVPQIDQIVRFK